MNKYVLTLAAAVLIAAAPAYYAFQAQAEEVAPATNEQGAAAQCSPTNEEMPAECAGAQAPSAGQKAPMPKQAGNE